MLSANDKPSTPNGLNHTIFTYPKESALVRPKTYYRMASNDRSDMDSGKSLQHIWIVTGPAGSGKTTVAKNLQSEMGVPFLEGDDVRVFFLSFALYFSFRVMVAPPSGIALPPTPYRLFSQERQSERASMDSGNACGLELTNCLSTCSFTLHPTKRKWPMAPP
jgi:hypothetical protein